MRVRHWLTPLVALLLIVDGDVIGGKGNASDNDPDKLSPSITEAKAAKMKTAGEGEINQAQLEAWHMNLAEWKELEPGEPADNSFCNVCHANFEDEKLVRDHLPEGIGCEMCHGISDKHSEDEDSLIPPDVVFFESRIHLFCILCHDKDELIESESDHKDLFDALEKPRDLATEVTAYGKKQADEKKLADEKKPADGKKLTTCINCHDFEHELKHRTRRWNKETGKLEWYDGVRMMQTREK